MGHGGRDGVFSCLDVLMSGEFVVFLYLLG